MYELPPKRNKCAPLNLNHHHHQYPRINIWLHKQTLVGSPRKPPQKKKQQSEGKAHEEKANVKPSSKLYRMRYKGGGSERKEIRMNEKKHTHTQRNLSRMKCYPKLKFEIMSKQFLANDERRR